MNAAIRTFPLCLVVVMAITVLLSQAHAQQSALILAQIESTRAAIDAADKTILLHKTNCDVMQAQQRFEKVSAEAMRQHNETLAEAQRARTEASSRLSGLRYDYDRAKQNEDYARREERARQAEERMKQQQDADRRQREISERREQERWQKFLDDSRAADQRILDQADREGARIDRESQQRLEQIEQQRVAAQRAYEREEGARQSELDRAEAQDRQRLAEAQNVGQLQPQERQQYWQTQAEQEQRAAQEAKQIREAAALYERQQQQEALDRLFREPVAIGSGDDDLTDSSGAASRLQRIAELFGTFATVIRKDVRAIDEAAHWIADTTPQVWDAVQHPGRRLFRSLDPIKARHEQDPIGRSVLEAETHILEPDSDVIDHPSHREKALNEARDALNQVNPENQKTMEEMKKFYGQ